MLELIDYKPVVIFTTAYDKYAIHAFEQNAIDYLLKPFSEERFNNALQKALDILNTNKKSDSNISIETEGKISRIVVKNNNTVEILPIPEIFYLEAQDDYIYIFSTKGRFIKKDTLKKYEKSLPEHFVRTHRSYIVNVNYIDKLEHYNKESYLILLKDQSKVKVSKQGYKLLKDKLGF
jgi:two-component system LytT family response regulator